MWFLGFRLLPTNISIKLMEALSSLANCKVHDAFCVLCLAIFYNGTKIMSYVNCWPLPQVANDGPGKQIWMNFR